MSIPQDLSRINKKFTDGVPFPLTLHYYEYPGAEHVIFRIQNANCCFIVKAEYGDLFNITTSGIDWEQTDDNEFIRCYRDPRRYVADFEYIHVPTRNVYRRRLFFTIEARVSTQDGQIFCVIHGSPIIPRV